jgi:hypothetical protein
VRVKLLRESCEIPLSTAGENPTTRKHINSTSKSKRSELLCYDFIASNSTFPSNKCSIPIIDYFCKTSLLISKTCRCANQRNVSQSSHCRCGGSCINIVISQAINLSSTATDSAASMESRDFVNKIHLFS